MVPLLQSREQMPEYGVESSVQNATNRRKVMFTLCFWDSQGPVLEHYQERAAAINRAYYVSMLCENLKPAI
jgi:hypothetical protein